jgi:ABC-2 type transport system ATP-binding protein
VALIRRGRLVAVDEIVALRATLQRRVDLLLSEPVPDMAARLAALTGASRISERDGRWQFLAADLPALLRLLADLPVLDVAIEPPSLADVFMRYYAPEETAGE